MSANPKIFPIPVQLYINQFARAQAHVGALPRRDEAAQPEALLELTAPTTILLGNQDLPIFHICTTGPLDHLITVVGILPPYCHLTVTLLPPVAFTDWTIKWAGRIRYGW